MTGPAHVQTLVEQVYERILLEICEGTLAPNARLIQDELAAAYEVSRQPVQQALMLLRDRGFVADAPKRGVVVTPLDAEVLRDVYEVREVLDGLACRLAAQRASDRARAEGDVLIRQGQEAIASGSVARQITADIAFHRFIYACAGNASVEEAARPHWHFVRRIMGAVLRVERRISSDIWSEHAAILDAIVASDPDRAERLGRDHIARAAKKFAVHVQALQAQAGADQKRRSLAHRAAG
ncbi:GntR family transcriptional regulator [Methylobacterium trifolii]|uniref:D-xylose utilization operon transcriptional repressor n=1 Tax=Methylobacterium trifolii TaxID=1003092 RepID=A0ABQ4U0V7_9HYPH|nr:GntR family transcriptional regulator [Methylobacterium trifolii]GJE59465.1 putative D-xylose utilization operon transcriptional repressor [Methylobacterium trifolii]